MRIIDRYDFLANTFIGLASMRHEVSFVVGRVVGRLKIRYKRFSSY